MSMVINLKEKRWRRKSMKRWIYIMDNDTKIAGVSRGEVKAEEAEPYGGVRQEWSTPYYISERKAKKRRNSDLFPNYIFISF